MKTNNNIDLVSLLKFITNLNPLAPLIATVVFGILRFVISTSLIPEVGQQPFRGILFWLFVFFLILFFWSLIIWIQAYKIRRKERKKAEQEKKEIEQTSKQAELELKIKNLYQGSKGILRDFLSVNNQPKELWVDDESVQQLESKGIIEKVGLVTIHTADLKIKNCDLRDRIYGLLLKHNLISQLFKSLDQAFCSCLRATFIEIVSA
jgi:cell division protein FtsB